MTKDALFFLVSWFVAAVAAPLSVRAFSRFWAQPRPVPVMARRAAKKPEAYDRRGRLHD
jgi:hypothetical protein